MTPIPYDEFIASRDMRNEAWRRRFRMQEQFRSRAPGPRPSRARLPLPRGQSPRGRSPRTSIICIRSRASPRSASSNCTAIPPMPRVLTAPGAMSWPGSRSAFEAGGEQAPDCPDCGGHIKTAHRLVRPGDAADPRCSAREELTAACDLFSPSAPRWWSGRLRVPADGQTQWFAARHHQSRAHRSR